MKKFLTTIMLMIVFLIPVAQAEILEPVFTESYTTVSHDVTPGLFTAIAADISVDRTCLAGGCVDKETTSDIMRLHVTASIGGGSSNGVSGGSTVGGIRS